MTIQSHTDINLLANDSVKKQGPLNSESVQTAESPVNSSSEMEVAPSAAVVENQTPSASKRRLESLADTPNWSPPGEANLKLVASKKKQKAN